MVIVMLNLINKILFYGKIILHIIVFCLTLYILFRMYDYYKDNVMNIFMVFLPMLLVSIVFVISFFFDKGNKNVFFNLANFLVLLSIAIICLRTMFDKNMIMGIKDGINYYYFQNQIREIKLLCYLMFLGNSLLIYQEIYNKQ